MESGSISTKPLTKEESKILLNFVEGSKIINNKATNATTNKMKNEEWQRIANQFNAVVTSCHRTAQQLRLKWENLKKNSRKRNTLIRMNNIKTGGGGPDYIPPDDVLDRVAALLGNTVDGLPVRYGGDAEVKPNLVCAKVGGGIQSDVEIDQEVLILEPTSMSPGIEILQEITLDNAENAGECSTVKQKQMLFTPRAVSQPCRNVFLAGLATNEGNKYSSLRFFVVFYLFTQYLISSKRLNLFLSNKAKNFGMKINWLSGIKSTLKLVHFFGNYDANRKTRRSFLSRV